MNGTLLIGASGRAYFYTPYAWGTRWRADPANYAFGLVDEASQWQLAYIGETANLRSRMATHSQWQAAAKLGCSHVLVNLNAGGLTARRREEQDLILKLQPSLNAQHLKRTKPRPARNGYYPTGW
ncbi:MAG TPA: hypothetical protein VHA35_18145 [Dongiaceae bacterium]|jgi:hypothetical protein|nr:hypothetical protein [Dongiaceae bacterium]